MPQKVRVTSPKVAEPPPGTWSNCLQIDNLIMVAGMTARTGTEIPAKGDMYGQSKIIFEKIRDLLTAGNARMDDIVKLVIYVTDIKRREEVWKARKEFFTGDFPVSTLVEVSALAMPELLVEIEAIAVRGAAGSSR